MTSESLVYALDHHLPHKFLWSIALRMPLCEGAEINRLNHKMDHIPSFSLREAPFYVGIRKRGKIVSDILGFKYIGLRIYQLTFDPVCENKH